jgi:integrase
VNELAADPDHLSLPAGLTVDDALRITEAINASHAASTRMVYALAWRQWERWCAARAAAPKPADPVMICAYLTERAGEGLSVGTIDLACSAISHHHRSHGLDDPILAEGVRQVRRGLRRLIGAAPRRQARPLGTEDIRQILDAIDRSSAKGARDAAIILLGFASAMRRSELVALTLADVGYKPGGVLLTIRRSKTDQYAESQVVAVVHGQHAATDPIAALDAWLTFRGPDEGPLFTSMRNKVVTLDPLSGEAVSIVLRKRAPRRRPGRRTHHRPLAARRARHHRGRRRRRPRPDRRADPAQAPVHPPQRYIRPAQALDLTSSRDLGL